MRPLESRSGDLHSSLWLTTFLWKLFENCGRQQGRSCVDCQNNLFCNIKEGKFSLSDRDWKMVDPLAKDLFTKLNVMNPKERLSAQLILYH